MGTLHHVYLTAHGEFTTTEWIGEKAQFGLRLPWHDATETPGKGSVWTPAVNGDVVPDTGTTSTTHGVLTRTWTARLGPTGSNENCDASVQADFAEDVYTFLDSIKSYVSNQFKWTEVRIAPVIPGGDYGAPAARWLLSTPLVGTSSATMLPPQVALALSLRGPVLGRRGRGRIYIPALTSTMASNGTVSNTEADTMKTAFVSLVNNLQQLPGTGQMFFPKVSVMSGSSLTAVRPSEVRVGNHFDIQRRRSMQVGETYRTTVL